MTTHIPDDIVRLTRFAKEGEQLLAETLDLVHVQEDDEGFSINERAGVFKILFAGNFLGNVKDLFSIKTVDPRTFALRDGVELITEATFNVLTEQQQVMNRKIRDENETLLARHEDSLQMYKLDVLRQLGLSNQQIDVLTGLI